MGRRHRSRFRAPAAKPWIKLGKSFRDLGLQLGELGVRVGAQSARATAEALNEFAETLQEQVQDVATRVNVHVHQRVELTCQDRKPPKPTFPE